MPLKETKTYKYCDHLRCKDCGVTKGLFVKDWKKRYQKHYIRGLCRFCYLERLKFYGVAKRQKLKDKTNAEKHIYTLHAPTGWLPDRQ